MTVLLDYEAEEVDPRGGEEQPVEDPEYHHHSWVTGASAPREAAKLLKSNARIDILEATVPNVSEYVLFQCPPCIKKPKQRSQSLTLVQPKGHRRRWTCSHPRVTTPEARVRICGNLGKMRSSF